MSTATNFQPWLPEEEAYFAEHLGHHTTVAIAGALRRPSSSLYAKLAQLKRNGAIADGPPRPLRRWPAR